MKKIIIYTTLAFYFLISPLQATLVIGDPNASTGNTFSFDIGHAKFIATKTSHRLWLASGADISSESDDVQKFGLSFVEEIPAEPLLNPQTLQLLTPTAQPLANKEAATIYTYNSTDNNVNVAQTDNPIYGAEFAFLDTAYNNAITPAGHTPTFVLAGSLNELYFAQDIKHNYLDPATNKRIFKTELLRHDFGTGDNVKALLGTSSNIFAIHAVGDFGDDATSKIAKLVPAKFVAKTITDSKGKEVQVTVPYLNKVADLSITSSTAELGSVTTLHSDVTLHSIKNNLYIGLNVTATGGANILIAKHDAMSFAFDSIATTSIFANETIISTTSNARITNIANMSTSTSLSYLIVARDAGSGTEPQTIYAIPLVGKEGTTFGKVADYTKITNVFQTSPSIFHKRYFDTPLEDHTQITPSGSVLEQLRVGQEIPPLASGNSIKDLYVVGDTVYVVIDQDYDTDQQPGTFCSQAIFAPNGHIISWTPWTRSLGTDEPTLFSATNRNTTSSFYVTDTGSGFRSVTQTQWLPSSNLAPLFQATHGTQGGTQGAFNFPQSTSGFNSAISLLITTGFNKVVIGQTGFVDGGHFKIKPMTSSDTVAFNSVSNNTALVSAELAHNGTDHWLFAGGASGLVVLSEDTGVTWTGNLSSVADFDTGQIWKQVGNFSFVKKVVWDNTFLYVLTNNALHQIALDKSKFINPSSDSLNSRTIIDSSKLLHNAALLDVIIDNGFCILGTTNGLYSLTISSGGAQQLQTIDIPDGLPAISQLLVASKVTEGQRSFKEKSNLYVLNNTFGTQQARLNRFTIEDSVITPFSDALINSSSSPAGIPSSFIRFNQYVSNYFTNGSLNLASTYSIGKNIQENQLLPPTIQQIDAGVHNGLSSSHVITPNLSSLVPTLFLRNVDMLLGVKQESTSGSLIISGNFEARVMA